MVLTGKASEGKLECFLCSSWCTILSLFQNRPLIWENFQCQDDGFLNTASTEEIMKVLGETDLELLNKIGKNITVCQSYDAGKFTSFFSVQQIKSTSFITRHVSASLLLFNNGELRTSPWEIIIILQKVSFISVIFGSHRKQLKSRITHKDRIFM